MIRLLAGMKSSGEPSYEHVLTEPVPGSTFVRVTATPGLVLDLAAGDVIEAGADGSFRTVSRGGNIAVQLYGEHETVDAITPGIEALGGWLDGQNWGLTVFTVPYRDGFTALEAVLNAFVAEHPGVEWYYGNVYDADDRPLNWWL